MFTCAMSGRSLLQGTNRLLLKWLKLWDFLVFGKERKIKDSQSDKTKKKDQHFQSNFLNVFAPQVIDELDNHQRPVQKV